MRCPKCTLDCPCVRCASAAQRLLAEYHSAQARATEPLELSEEQTAAVADAQQCLDAYSFHRP